MRNKIINTGKKQKNLKREELQEFSKGKLKRDIKTGNNIKSFIRK